MNDPIPQFVLARAVLASNSSLTLAPTEYAKLIAAKKLIIEALALEEKFDLVLTNYVEFEKTLNDLATEHMVRHEIDYNVFNECRVTINQRVQNLLSAARLYLDHGAHHSGQMEVAVPNLANEFRGLTAKEYQNNAAYRIAEALRNHSQHRGFPVGSFSSGGEWVERPNSEEVNLHQIEAHIDVQAMKENPKTKELVLTDLENLGKKADVRPVLRSYVESFATIHETMRRKLEAAITDAEAEIDASIERFKSAFPDEGSVVGLAAFELGNDGRPISETAIFKKFVERRRHLVQRNSILTNLSRRHISSEPKAKAKP